MLFMTRTGQKQNFGKIQPLKSNPGGTHLYDLEAQKENNMCRDSISLLMLFLFFFMPPLWLAMGLGYLDSVAGEVKQSHKKAALALGGTMMVAVVVGISVGLGVGLTR
jgi:type III secretory pathway component EscS